MQYNSNLKEKNIKLKSEEEEDFSHRDQDRMRS